MRANSVRSGNSSWPETSPAVVDMDKVAELASPDDVVDAQDLVVLKLDRPWSGPHAVPAGCVLDSSSQRITTNQKSFVANKDNLTKQRFSAALFAGCSAFATYTALSNAAVEVLKKAETLVLVHNRDLVMDLVQRFPGLRLLVLMHDLRLQTEAKHRLDVCGKRSSRLRQVVGTAPALGMDHLFLCPVTLISLLANCDMVRPSPCVPHSPRDWAQDSAGAGGGPMFRGACPCTKIAACS